LELFEKINKKVCDNGLNVKINRYNIYNVIFSHDFARAFFGEEQMKIGVNLYGLPIWLYNLKAMVTYEDPLAYLEKFFVEVKEKSFDCFEFERDIFLCSTFPFTTDSKDDWSPIGCDHEYHYKPLSLVADFWSGEEMAAALLKKFPGKSTLLDLGTATGSVPLTMRETGMLAVGVDGLDVRNFDIRNYMMARPERFCWNVAPGLVTNCDITQPFSIVNQGGALVQFDFIISTDCFEHLITGRIPEMLKNVHNHLKDDGYGIFEINTGAFWNIHQTVEPKEWWMVQFREHGFEICEDLSVMDFPYVRSYLEGGKLVNRVGDPDEFKVLFWVRKKSS